MVRSFNTSNPLELEFGAPPGNHHNPSQQAHRSRPRTITNTCRTSTAAPSRLGGGNHQENTRIPQQMNTQVPTRCKLTSKCTWDHSISFWLGKQAREMSGRGCAQLKGVLEWSTSQEKPPKSRPTSIYRRSQQELAVRHLKLLQSRWPDALVELTRRADAHTTHARKRDRTRWSRDRPDALVKPSNAPASQRPDAHDRWTGRHSTSVRSFPVSLHAWPDTSSWSWPDAPPRPIRRPRRAQTLSTDRTRPVKQRLRSVQCPITSVTFVRLRFFAPGAVENRRFISRKALNLAAQTPPPSQMC
jgi:hypothetical protein